MKFLNISTMNEKQKHILFVVVIVLVVILILAGVGFFTYYNSKHSKSVPVDQVSKDRMTVLNELFTSLFGPRWPFIMIGFAVLLILIMVTLYLLTKKEYTMSDTQSGVFTKALISFTVVFAIGILFFAAKAYRDQRVKEETGDIPNYIPSDNERKKMNKILAIVGLGLLILLITGGIAWHLFGNKIRTVLHSWLNTPV